MKIRFLVVGKTSEKAVSDLAEIYFKKLEHYCSFSFDVIPNITVKSENPDKVKEQESVLILKKISESDYLILLDENGEQFSSEGFAKKLQSWLNSGRKTLVFLVGGAFGFHESVYKRANYKISLSPMTFSHQLVRPIFAEQLYRSFTILKNEPYHHK